MRSIKFISRTQQKITAKLLYINGKVWRIVNSIQYQPCIVFVRKFTCLLYVIDSADRISSHTNRYNACVLIDFRFEVIIVQHTTLAESYFFYFNSKVAEHEPRTAIAFMIELRDDYFITGL